ncbi:pre-mRNA-splicing factor CLF1 [Gracilaria domingensis]|nr:pre-mRNA-splicing factor CLF1 [Gracilaria domingensis]
MASIPKRHRKFSFGKLWIYYAQAEIRNKDVQAARKIFGTGLGVLPHKHILYETYIEFERSLGEFDRVRKIYENWLTRNPTHEPAFVSLADLEVRLGEVERARLVLEMATSVDELRSSSKLWEKLADVVKLEDETSAIRRFEGYVNTQPHAAVWIAYIYMMNDLQAADEAVRRIFKRSVDSLREEAIAAKEAGTELREEVFDMANKWLSWEMEQTDGPIENGDKSANVALAKKAIPKRVKKTRKTEDGDEEYWQIVFLEEETNIGGIGNLLEAARRWKQQQQNG